MTTRPPSRAVRIPDGARVDRAFMVQLVEWQAAAVRLDAVDPVTTEMVRLRCARHHDCHT